MAYKSQNNEAEVLLGYFNGTIGNLLDIGANDGETFSNSYDLIKEGWSGVLIDPVKECCEKIKKLYIDNDFVFTLNIGIGNATGKQTLYQPGDTLLATTNESLLGKWKHVKDWQQVETIFLTFKDAQSKFTCLNKKFDFINIDCEGLDWDILQQIDLNEVGCKCICIEHSSIKDVYFKIIKYCSSFGLNKEILYNGENTILAR